MSLTENSEIMGRFHESAFNRILNEIMLQNPKTFNYATSKVINNNSYCSPIAINSALVSMGAEKCTEVPKLPIIGSTNSNLGLDYSVQIKDLKVDFAPTSSIQLPPELGGLALQQFALKGTVCAGLECDQIHSGNWWNVKDLFVHEIKPDIKHISNKVSSKQAKLKRENKLIKKGLLFVPFDNKKMNCFCLSLYAKVILVNNNDYLRFKLLGIELEDLAPLGLENSIECYLKQVLDNTVFPKLKIAIEDLVFDVGSFFNVSLTPTSTSLPNNPNISNNYLSIFLNIN